jgi:hypothetical protein
LEEQESTEEEVLEEILQNRRIKVSTVDVMDEIVDRLPMRFVWRNFITLTIRTSACVKMSIATEQIIENANITIEY